MFDKFFVVRITMNIEGGVAQNISAYDTEKQATDKFYDELSQFGGNPSVSVVRMILLSNNGIPMNDIVRDNRQIAE